MNLIDPYGLLGATVDSTSAEVKQAYHGLSRLVHPDKGGSAADMIVVNNAYKYVMAQLSEVNHTVTLEDLEQQFALFCTQQLVEPPSSTQMTAQMQLFHNTFDNLPRGDKPGQALRASMTAGYEEFMEQSEYRTHEELRPQGSVREHDCVPFESQVIVYVEPETSATDTALCFSELTHPDGLEDYSTTCPALMTDYRSAFNTNYEVLPEARDCDLNRTFEEVVASRQALDPGCEEPPSAREHSRCRGHGGYTGPTRS